MKDEFRDDRNKIFDGVMEDTFQMLKNLLLTKASEYKRNNNPYHNFEEGAKRRSITREEVLDGFRLKHEISVADMREDLKKDILPSIKSVNEKYNDILVYYLIEKACMTDRIVKQTRNQTN